MRAPWFGALFLARSTAAPLRYRMMSQLGWASPPDIERPMRPWSLRRATPTCSKRCARQVPVGAWRDESDEDDTGRDLLGDFSDEVDAGGSIRRALRPTEPDGSFPGLPCRREAWQGWREGLR